jgi:NAD(P)-dependent dehydrogenase (short-subunit alcohol dehydrogenase family)
MAARDTKLIGRGALVTGAGKRVGRAIALALARAGADVAVHYQGSEAEAREVASELEALGVKAPLLRADLSDAAELESLIPRASEAIGTLEILVNNASIFPSDTLMTTTRDSLERNAAVNAWAPLVLIRAFAVQTERGHVVNLLDSRVTGFDRSHVGYILSKHALGAITRLAAIELAPGIAVNGVAPGLILPPPGEDDSYVERLARTVPLARRGAPEDIADAVIFLVSSRFITGEVIYVDGGRHLQEYSRSGPDTY